MFGKYSSGMTSISDKVRLPPPVFAAPEKLLSKTPESQRDEFRQTSGNSQDFNNPDFSHSRKPWNNRIAPEQSNRKERFAKPPKHTFQRPRNFYNAYQPRGRGSSSFYCDSCDRGFSTHEEYEYHSNHEHVTCGLDGCKLSAHPKVVEKHQKIQHLSGLYLRLMSHSSKNPEDVAKWIAERKKNYPTKENVERRKEMEKERLERGETLQPERRRFGRFGGRGNQRGMQGRGGRGIGRDRKHSRRHSHSKEGHTPRNNRGRGRGGRGKISERVPNRKYDKIPEKVAEEKLDAEWEDKKGIPMFCGTAALFGIQLKDDESSEEEILEEGGDFSDSEWLMDDVAAKHEGSKINENGGDTDGRSTKPKKDSVVLNNALGILIGTYGSDDSNSDEEDSKPEDQPPAKRVCLRDKSDNLQKPPVVTNTPIAPEKKALENRSTSNVDKVNAEDDSDDSGPEVECIKKAPIMNAVSSNKIVAENKKMEEDSDSGPEVECIKKAPIENAISSNKIVVESERMEEDSDSAPEVVSIKEEPKKEGMNQVDVKKEEEGEGKKFGEGKKRVRRSRRRGRPRGGKANIKKNEEEENAEEEKAAMEDEARAARGRKELEMKQMQRYPTLLEELLKDEIRRERNFILQCIRYVVENNFFDKTEVLSPGVGTVEKKSVISEESNSSELENPIEHNSTDNAPSKDVVMTELVDEKHKNAVSSSVNNDGEVEESNSSRVACQKECDVGEVNINEMECTPLEGEVKGIIELGKDKCSNISESKAAYLQSSIDCPKKETSNSSKTGGDSEEKVSESPKSSQVISNYIVECKNSIEAMNKNVLGYEERQSNVECSSALDGGIKAIKETNSNCDIGNHVSESPKPNDAQPVNDVCENNEIISVERCDVTSKSTVEQDESVAQVLNACLSVKEEVLKQEISSSNEKDDIQVTESMEISSEDCLQNVNKLGTEAETPVKESEETKGSSSVMH